jgi:hypothetical protein
MSSGVESESPVRGSDRRGPTRARAARLEAGAGELLVGREPGGEVAPGVREGELVRDPAGRLPDRLDYVPAEPGVELVGRLSDRAAGEEQQQKCRQRHRLDRVPGCEPAQVPAVEALHQAVVAVRLALAAGARLGLHLGDRLEILRDEALERIAWSRPRHQKRK